MEQNLRSGKKAENFIQENFKTFHGPPPWNYEKQHLQLPGYLGTAQQNYDIAAKPEKLKHIIFPEQQFFRKNKIFNCIHTEKKQGPAWNQPHNIGCKSESVTSRPSPK